MRSVNLIAAKAVALHGPGTLAERREILAMLGLIDPAGGITPDRRTAPAHIEPVNDINPQGKNRAITQPRPANCTTPPLLAGLANPSPTPAVQRQPKTEPKPEPKPVTACGTMTGKAQHVRRGEPVCRACRDVQNEYERRRLAQKAGTEPRPARRRPPRPHRRWNPNPALLPRPETCGSMAGRSNHLRRGEKLCPRCAEFFSVYQREKRARRRAEKRALAATDTPRQEKTA